MIFFKKKAFDSDNMYIFAKKKGTTMQTSTLRTGTASMRPLRKEDKDTLPKNCVPLSKFKRDFFRLLKKRYEKV